MASFWRPDGTTSADISRFSEINPFQRTTRIDFTQLTSVESLYEHGVFKYCMPNSHQTAELITAEELREKAEPMKRRIWENYSTLRYIVTRHEATIQGRWTKTSKCKRRDVILRTWGSGGTPIPRSSRSPLKRHENLREPLLLMESLTEFPTKHEFFWPYLALENLSETEPLLLLLNARGRHSPAVFAHNDLKPAHRGMLLKQVPYPLVLKEWNMCFLGRDSVETYGEMVSWKGEPIKAPSQLHRSMHVSPGEGLWILEIQDLLYRFLVDACHNILHDVDLTVKVLQCMPEREEPTRFTSKKGEKTLTASLAELRSEAPYKVPRKFSAHELCDLVAAKKAGMEDALLALREDPGTFTALLVDLYDHYPELLLEFDGEQHPIMCAEKDSYRRAFVDTVARNMVCWHIHNLELWEIIHDKLAHLADIKEKLFDRPEAHVEVDDDLPSELELAFMPLLYYLKFVIGYTTVHVPHHALCRPPLSQYFRCQVPPESEEVTMRHSLGGMPLKPPEPLTNVFKEFKGDIVREYVEALLFTYTGDWRDFMGIDPCLETMERIAQDPKIKKLMTAHIQGLYSNLALATECIRQLLSFTPWADSFEARVREDMKLRSKLDTELLATRNRMRTFGGWIKRHAYSEAAAGFFKMKYPVEKARTKTNVEAMRKAEAALENLWAQFLDEFEKEGVMTERLSNLLERAQPECTPEWTPPVKKPADSTLTGLLAGQSSRTFPTTEPTGVQPIQSKPKTKTRGRAPPLSTDNPAGDKAKQDDTGEVEETAPKPMFPVDKRAFKVMSTLYFRPSPDSQPGEISWQGFLYAMSKVGFGYEKLGGSAWQFTPGPKLQERYGYGRSIHFHEPHPVSKVPFRIMRNFGRRLATAYGWDGQSFVME